MCWHRNKQTVISEDTKKSKHVGKTVELIINKYSQSISIKIK